MSIWRFTKSILKDVGIRIFQMPNVVKKKVLRSKPIRNILAKQLSRVLTSVLEIHILAIACITVKYIGQAFLEYTSLDSQTARISIEWAADILVPVIFALRMHTSFASLVYWLFEKPLFSLARRIQYMKPNDLYQFLKVKYTILVPSLIYIATLIQFMPLNQHFIQICLFQTLVIQCLTDFWPLRNDLIQIRVPAPSHIHLIDKQNLHKTHSLVKQQIQHSPPPPPPLKGTVTFKEPHFHIESSNPFENVMFSR